MILKHLEMASDEYNIVDINPKSSSSSSSDTNCSITSAPIIDNDNNRGDSTDHSEHFDDVIEEKLPQKTIIPGDQCGSPSAGRHDPVQSSLESSDLNVWIRSGND